MVNMCAQTVILTSIKSSHSLSCWLGARIYSVVELSRLYDSEALVLRIWSGGERESEAVFSYARHATDDSRHILSPVVWEKINVCSVTCDTINSFHTKMTSIELLQDELIIASAAFIIPSQRKSKGKRRWRFHSNFFYINQDRHVGHLYATLLNELSAFGEMFKQQIVNSSPKYCIS